MKSYNDMVSEIDTAITKLMAIELKSYYYMSAEITKVTADRLRKYYLEKGYNVEVTMCPRKNYDIIIRWS